MGFDSGFRISPLLDAILYTMPSYAVGLFVRLLSIDIGDFNVLSLWSLSIVIPELLLLIYHCEVLEAFLKEIEISSLTQGIKVDKEARDSTRHFHAKRK